MWTNEFVNHVVFAMVIIAVHHVFFVIVIFADDPNDGIL